MDIRKFFSPPGKTAAGKKSAPTASLNNNNNINKVKDKSSEDVTDGTRVDSSRKSSSSKRKLDAFDSVVAVDSDSAGDEPESPLPRKRQKRSSPSKKREKRATSKNGSDRKRGKKKRSSASRGDEDEDEDVVIVDEDENPIPNSVKRKKSEKVSSVDEDFEKEVATKSKKPKIDDKSKKRQKKGTVIYDSDSDDDEPKPTKQRKPRKKKEIIAVSDDEQPGPLRSAFQHAADTAVAPPVAKKPTAAKATGKPTTVLDFFGSATVQRSTKLTTGTTPNHPRSKLDKSENKRDRSKNIETAPPSFDASMELFDDDDFKETLRLIDTDALDKQQQQTESEGKESKESTRNDKSGQTSLASKISAKAKVYVEDTPEKFHGKSAKQRIDEESSDSRNTIRDESERMDVSPTKTTPEKQRANPSRHGDKNSPVSKKSPKKSPVKTPPDTGGKSRGNPGYWAYKNRAGPSAPGSKEIPEGGENCLEGLTFVVTGVLESLERDEAKSLIERYGGKMTTSLSKKTSYVVIGDGAGESKMAKVEQFKTKQLDEDGFLDLIRTLPAKKSKYTIAAEAEAKKRKSQSTPKSSSLPAVDSADRQSSCTTTPKSSKFSQSQPLLQTPPATSSQKSDWSQKTASPQPSTGTTTEPSLLWVDKYKPSTLKHVIGQQGDKSNARKLLHWLVNWQKNRTQKQKFSGNRWNDDGASFKAALLSGPPGIGKTTTAHLVCKEAGFSFIELNASDTRSKKNLEEHVMTALRTKSLVNYIGTGKEENTRLNHCLLMDEVDGMAGNEDRGGMQELIKLIKSSRIPIICMCNDRAHIKIRSLANYCFDLRFSRPRVEQIKSAAMSIVFKEGLNVSAPALNEIILASNQDVRQVIHNLEMFCSKDKSLDYDQAKKDASAAKKDFKIGPFDACRQVFSGSSSSMTVDKRSELFFEDYGIMPLFVQENYIQVKPFSANGDLKKHLSALSTAADSMCDGDLVDRCIRGNGCWSLLPLQGVYSTVIPGTVMAGHMTSQISFPGWLGKNSTTRKTDRIIQELNFHMRLKISADKRALNLDYRPHLKHALTKPLFGDDSTRVGEVVALLDEYSLLKDDFDSVMEISQWSNSPDVMSKILPKIWNQRTRVR
ncbi:replication factor C subunit 1-like isoform X2 [Tubulanus polymorphus]|uniref:replication factor C subunit 1-like isoform X2 n=1 Tax=Tubulanus polymorphus TaxID=672921 RepID=UPI003DA42A4E